MGNQTLELPFHLPKELEITWAMGGGSIFLAPKDYNFMFSESASWSSKSDPTNGHPVFMGAFDQPP